MPSANPAPGWRDSGVRSTDAGGTLHSVGNTGHCWASAITGSNADFLAFDPNWLHPQYYYSRGYGRQLRCLQVPLGTRTGQPLPQAEDGDAKHRDSFEKKFSARDSPPFSAQCRLVETGGRRHPRRKAAISRSRSSDLRWRRPKNKLRVRFLLHTAASGPNASPLRVAASGLCGENPSFQVPSGTSPRPGWPRPARPYGVQIPNWPTNFRAPGPKNCSAPPLRPTVSVRALGEILLEQLS